MNPKSYYAYDLDSTTFKRSSKGVQHKIKLTYEDYKRTIYTSEEKLVENTVIRMHDGQMNTMACKKVGLRDVFIKAFVQDDKTTVRPFPKNAKMSF